MSTVEKLTPERIEELAKEIREFLLEHGLWQDVDIRLFMRYVRT